MKQTAKLAMLAIALSAGISGTAMANGNDRPMPEKYTAPPAAPASESVVRPAAAPIVESRSNTGPYVSGNIGAAIPGKDYIKTGYLLNGAVGYNFDPVRVEGAVGYQRNELETVGGHVFYWTFMGNAYYDFDEMSGVKPYVTAGAGVANGHWANRSSTDFAWQVGAGLGVKIAERTMLDIGYRYFKPDDGNVVFSSHNVTAGIRYQF